jgi:hypothetical protein
VFVHISPGVSVHPKTGFLNFRLKNVLLGLEIDEPSGTRPFQSTDKSFRVSGFGWSPLHCGWARDFYNPPYPYKTRFYSQKG